MNTNTNTNRSERHERRVRRMHADMFGGLVTSRVGSTR